MPRKLTDDEINEVTNVIPKPISGTFQTSEKIRKELVYVQKALLRDQKIHPDALEDLKREIINNWRRSTVEPGLPIGLLTGEALGSEATQGVLNTFHHAGQLQTVGSGTTGELLNATQYRKNESTFLHFKNHDMTFENVLEYERVIVGTTIGMLCMNTQIKLTSEHIKEWWYDLYLSLNPRDISSQHFLRLHFDLNYLYKYNVTLSDIVSKLEFSDLNGKHTIACIPSPISDGIIDIYPIKTTIKESVIKSLDKDDTDIPNGINDENITILFLELVVKPNLSNILVKGVHGIKRLFSISLQTISLILDIVPLEDKWKIWINLIKMRTTGIPLTKLIKFLEECGCIIHNKSPEKTYKNPFEKSLDNNSPLSFKEDEKANYIIISMPEGWKKKENYKDPSEYLEDDVQNELGLSLINSFRKSEYSDSINDWTIIFNNPLSENDLTDVIKFCEYNKIKINNKEIKQYIHNNIQYIDLNKIISFDVTMKEGWEVSEFKKPEDFFKHLIEEEKKLASEYIREHKLKGVIYPIYNYSNRYKAALYNYAELIGNNLKTILSLEEIDSTRTTCNSPHDILTCFGIEACRNFIAHTFFEIISNSGSYVNLKYTDFVADFMTVLGSLIPITSKGVIKHNRGALADATFQEPLTRFINSALFGGKENVDSTSASIFIGKRMNLGTGYTKYLLDESVIKSLQKVDISSYILDELKEMENEDDFETQNQQMDFGQDNLFGDDLDLSKVNFLAKNTSEILKGAKKRGPPKGPIPEIIQIIDEVPDIIKNILDTIKKNQKDINIPKLSDLNIDSILEKFTRNKEKEVFVGFLDTNYLKNNIKIHLEVEKDQDDYKMGTSGNIQMV